MLQKLLKMLFEIGLKIVLESEYLFFYQILVIRVEIGYVVNAIQDSR